MAWQAVLTDVITTGPAITILDGDDLFVASGVLVMSLEREAVTQFAAFDQHILVGGTLSGGTFGIYSYGGGSNVFEILRTGTVAGLDSALVVAGDGHLIDNEGLIQGGELAGIHLTGSAVILNEDTILGDPFSSLADGGRAILVADTSIFCTVVNTGTIDGIVAFEDRGQSTDVVVNAGFMIGDVLLGGGDDLFDGRYGTHLGEVCGEAGNDRLMGSADDDILCGGEGNDVLAGGAGADWLDGGDGQDVAHYGSAPDAIVASLAGTVCGCGWADGDIYIDIERLAGSRFADWLEGDDGNNVLAGNAGDDTLLGGLGRDTLVGGAGADELVGGAGNDRAGYGTATTGVVASLGDPSINTGDAAGDSYFEIEGLVGSAHDDELRGSGASDTLWGGQGDDTLAGARGQDTLYGGAGADFFEFSDLGTAQADRIADFVSGVDVIVLTGTRFAALPPGSLDPGAFTANADGVAQDADDRIILETDTGFLTYDADGAGGAAGLRIARLGVGTVVTADDFLIA